MKIIFLDIDGVLNHEEWYDKVVTSKVNPINQDLDPSSIGKINRIISLTDAKIVLSSSWRVDSNCATMLYKSGLFKDSIIDKTPYIHHDENHMRGFEIQKWLDETGYKIFSYVIIDDDKDMLDSQMSNFIQTSRWTGITDEDVDKCIKILNNET